MGRKFFITTAIDYTNGAPHIGHAYEKVLADVIARFHRLRGDDVFFLTGVDQHGQKVQQSAEKQSIAPQEFVDGVTEKFRALWKQLDLEYDGWAATTDDRHKECVRQILERLHSTGQLYKKKDGGFYSVRQEQFLTDKERGPDGEFGPEWGEVEFREEENYYFRLAEHRQWLLELIEDRSAEKRPFVQPEFRIAELRNAVEKLSGDLCISRPKSRLSWGIPLPFDEEFVTYVWFDALVNYLSFAPGYDPMPARPPEHFLQWWREAVHVIGKDIMVPAHGVYWPIMLKALGFVAEEIPPLFVHGWWNVAGSKMSKSVGNSIDPVPLVEKYGAEAVRYYLVSDIASGRDADFSEERLIQRYNVDLANSLGNLLNRTLNMVQKYRDGVLSRGDADVRAVLAGAAGEAVAETTAKYETMEIHAALEATWKLIDRCNLFVEENAPWKLAKNPELAGVLDGVLYGLAEALRIVAILASPVLPNTSLAILAQLDPQSTTDRPLKLPAATWGGFVEGHALGKPTPLFPRIEPQPAA